MFKDYYKLLGISSTATDGEIKIALEQSTLSNYMVEEMKMVLQNKSLKNLYDEELHLYNASEEKNNYVVCNVILERELKKIKAYISNKTHESVTVGEKPTKNKQKYTWLWVVIGFVILCLAKCASSYYKGVRLEENAQKYNRGEYNYSIDKGKNKKFIISHYVKPFLKRV